MKAYIYILKNLINNKVYIGKTINPAKRKTRHFSTANTGYDKNHKYQLIHKAIAKYGKDNFTFEILEEHETEQKAFDREEILVEEHKSRERNFGYNLKKGGRGGSHNQEVIDKLKQQLSLQKILRYLKQLFELSIDNYKENVYVSERTGLTKNQLKEKYNQNKLNRIKLKIKKANELKPIKLAARQEKAKLKRIKSLEEKSIIEKQIKYNKYLSKLNKNILNLNKKFLKLSTNQLSVLNKKYQIQDLFIINNPIPKNIPNINYDIKKLIVQYYSSKLFTGLEISSIFGITFSQAQYFCYKFNNINDLISDEEIKLKNQNAIKKAQAKIHSPEEKAKLILKLKSKKVSNEEKIKISIKNSGSNNGMYGKIQSEQNRQKLSELHKNRLRNPISEEQKEKLKICGKKSKESIANIINNEIREQIRKDYLSRHYTKQQLANKYQLPLIVIKNIIRNRTKNISHTLPMGHTHDIFLPLT